MTLRSAFQSVTVRLAGRSDLNDATAGKPDC
jgi:hypothetical protein